MVNGELSIRRIARHCCAGLHTHMGLTAAFEPVFPDVLGFLKGFLHIARLDMAGHVNITSKPS